ncbi:hypothetical protein [Rhodoferax sp. WC2427]|uniref:hypothetical protein n=1 Tax=Rhodoferax sp. WC2427 TaxID=3234144 RepID=UPI00346777FF
MSNQEIERTLHQLERAYDRLIERSLLGRKLELPKVVRVCLVLRGLCHDGHVVSRLRKFHSICEHLTRLIPPTGFDESEEIRAGKEQLRHIREQLVRVEQYAAMHPEPWQGPERRVANRRREGPSSEASL